MKKGATKALIWALRTWDGDLVSFCDGFDLNRMRFPTWTLLGRRFIYLVYMMDPNLVSEVCDLRFPWNLRELPAYRLKQHHPELEGFGYPSPPAVPSPLPSCADYRSWRLGKSDSRPRLAYLFKKVVEIDALGRRPMRRWKRSSTNIARHWKR